MSTIGIPYSVLIDIVMWMFEIVVSTAFFKWARPRVAKIGLYADLRVYVLARLALLTDSKSIETSTRHLKYPVLDPATYDASSYLFYQIHPPICRMVSTMHVVASDAEIA